jgi:hypothetical protein
MARRELASRRGFGTFAAGLSAAAITPSITACR